MLCWAVQLVIHAGKIAIAAIDEGIGCSRGIIISLGRLNVYFGGDRGGTFGTGNPFDPLQGGWITTFGADPRPGLGGGHQTQGLGRD